MLYGSKKWNPLTLSYIFNILILALFVVVVAIKSELLPVCQI